jgi:anti-sigma factor RsiW
MHTLLRENLEGYLSGNLPPADREALEAHLAVCSDCRGEWLVLRESAEQIRSLRPPEEFEAEVSPAFYAAVIERIDREREIPFWAMLLDPTFGRRVVFACLLLLALLGAYVAAVQPTDYPSQHRPEAILAGQGQASPLLRPARQLGPNLERNRSVVLASLVSEGD